MKTLQLLVEITVPDFVNPNQIVINEDDYGYFIYANDVKGDRAIDQTGNCEIRYCTDPAAPTEIFIVWSTDDLESRATEKEDDNDGYNDEDYAGNHDILPTMLYDRSKFPDALSMIESEHDAELGITWDTLDYYLDEYCLLDK